MSLPPRSTARLLVLVGPSGTGKSAVAVRVASEIGAEIIGCDALQVYRGFDAATAKPGPAERFAVPHHLVDCVDPTVDFTLADYVTRAERAIDEIAARGRVALLVGGTGLYLRGLLRGVLPAPVRDEGLRRRLRAIVERGGQRRLHDWLRRRDPASAERIHASDTQRLVRAIEIARSAGGSWTERLGREGSWSRGAERYPSLKIGLDFEDRREHARRLDERVGRFFDAGLVEEVRDLLARGVPPTANAFKAIGYREVLAALARGAGPDAVREEVCRNTRRYVKRQRSWFRTEPDIVWLDALPGADALASKVVEAWRRVS